MPAHLRSSRSLGFANRHPYVDTAHGEGFSAGRVDTLDAFPGKVRRELTPRELRQFRHQRISASAKRTGG